MNEQYTQTQHPLVFIHGSGDSGRVWHLQVEHFGTQHAFALDLPGHGQRPDTFPAEVTVHEYAQAAHDIIMQELHLQKPIIVGHSLGGAIAQTMALEYSNELGGIVLVGTGARLRVLPSILADAKNTPEQVTPGPTIRYRDLAACDVFDIMKRLHEISIPTLILCGMEDQLTPVKYSTYLHQHIQGSTLRLIPNAGHYVMREQPEAVNSAIDEWVQTQFSLSTH